MLQDLFEQMECSNQTKSNKSTHKAPEQHTHNTNTCDALFIDSCFKKPSIYKVLPNCQ